MEKLSGLDASFLYLETPSQLMHVIGVFELDPSTTIEPYSFSAMRDELERRILAMPAFRRKLRDSILNLDHPVWIDDDDFDITRHVHRIGVPTPGTEMEVAELCSHLAATPLNRDRPLWEMWFIEGMADGGVTVMTKIHHATVDGVTGADLMAELCTLTPDPPELDDDKVAQSAGGTNRLELAVSGALNLSRRPLSMVRLLPQTAQVPVRWLMRARRNSAMPAPFSAPRTSFNRTITAGRTMSYTQVDLDDIKRIKNHYDAKINDVVLAVVGGALREFLAATGDLPDQPLVGVVPVSVHGEASDDDVLTAGTNKVTGMFTQLATHIADPVERLTAIRDSVLVSKDHLETINGNLLRRWAQFIPPNTTSMITRLYGDKKFADHHPVIYNLVISNVPGPDFPLYFLGARIKTLFPLGPLFHGAGLNITVISVDGKLNIGAIACSDLVGDSWPLMRAFEHNVKALLETIP